VVVVVELLALARQAVVVAVPVDTLVQAVAMVVVLQVVLLDRGTVPTEPRVSVAEVDKEHIVAEHGVLVVAAVLE
jgi:hypothetical protein